jgi:eukaryotic-like serine/threonine-protein kinase
MTEAPLNHPDDETLRAMSQGQLTEAELALVSTHLDDCPACCRRIDKFTTEDRLLARLQQLGERWRVEGGRRTLVSRVQRRSAVRALRQSHETRSTTPYPSASTLRPPTQVGKYDILAEVGRGGMGVVYKARHRGLNRLSALKMVLAGEFASPTQELRFRLEAELAARVLHPNIVQVYEIGSYEGRPFLALEWVDGGSLANRLPDGKAWPPGEAAALIETLARAIDVAHAQGVVHRDLKPANILLVGNAQHCAPGVGDASTLDGTVVNTALDGISGGGRIRLDGTTQGPLPTTLVPKITDFGLAQTIEGGNTMTQSGLLVGTPGYMAPEQAGGKRALVGPATDIYALGVVLYRLLAGQLPFQRDNTLELLRAVTSDEPPRPRRLQPRLPRDLEAITLHCLEKEPSRRYPNALALAEDLQRFREGKQVLARPVGEIERLWRWCQRKPVIAGLLAALILAVSLGLFGMSWAYFVAETARQAEKEKRLEADEQRKRAETARDRTRQALDAMTSWATGDSLTTQKEISVEQKKFLTDVLTYYQEFAGEKADDEQSRSRTAEAAFRVGQIEYRLGRKAEAEAANRLACNGYAKLAADFPAKPEYRFELAGSHLNLGVVLSDLEKRPEAEAQYRNALVICEKLAADFPAMPEYRHYLALGHHNLGDLLRRLGRSSDAKEQYRQAVTILEKLAAKFPAMPEYRQRLGRSHAYLGRLLREQGEPPHGEAHYRKALVIQEKLAAEFPAMPDCRYDLAVTHEGLGIVLLDLGKRPEGEEHYRKGLAACEKLATDFPAEPKYRSEQAGIRMNLGILLEGLGKWPEAEEQYRKALAIQEKLAADFPTVPEYAIGLGGVSCDLGILVVVSGQPGDSLVWFEKAIRTLTGIYEQDRRLVEACQFLCNSYAGRARAYGLLGKYAEAVRDLDRAVELSANQDQTRLCAERSSLRLMAGQVAEAVSEVAELSKTPGWNAEQWYNFACVYAVASSKLADKKQEYTDRAMVLLQQAVKAGYHDDAHLKQDSDLDSLRGRNDFKQLLAELAK